MTKQEDTTDDFELITGSDDLLTFNFMPTHLEELTELQMLPGSLSEILSPNSLCDDTTMDVAEKCKTFLPESKYGPPDRGVFPGELNFEVQVHSSDVHKRRYLYSSKINRIYVDMDVNFSMQFVWEWSRAPRPMYVRATTVFSDDAQAEKRVDRCLQHAHSINADTDPKTVRHVLRSTRSTGTSGVYYCGDEARPDSWYSVLVEFPTAPDDGSLAYSHAYQFVCKNSCSTGINRRSIDIIFTLEDQCGRIYGRQSVGARVCSCPRRDMLKDEEMEGAYIPGKKRVASNKIERSAHVTKKIKMEAVDEDEAVYTLPPGLQIVGSKTLVTGLNVWLNMMEQASSYKKHDQKAQEKLTKSIASVKNLIDQFKSQ